MAPAGIVGPRNPLDHISINELSDNLKCIEYADGTVYEIRINTGDPFNAIADASEHIPEKDREVGRWLSAFDEGSIYLSLCVSK